MHYESDRWNANFAKAKNRVQCPLTHFIVNEQKQFSYFVKNSLDF